MISLLSACGQNSEITKDSYPIENTENINLYNQSDNITYDDKALEEEPLYRERIQHKPRKAFFQKAALITGGISTILAIILVGRFIEGDTSLETEIKKPLFFKNIEVEAPQSEEPFENEEFSQTESPAPNIDFRTRMRRRHILYKFSQYPFKNKEDVAKIMVQALLDCIKVGMGTPEEILKDLNGIELKWNHVFHQSYAFLKEIRYKSWADVKDAYSKGAFTKTENAVDIKDLIIQLLKKEEGFKDLN